MPMIPLSIPNLAGNEWLYVKDCLDTGWVSSVGAYVNKFEKMVAEFAGVPYGVAAVNGTNALHLSLQLVGVRSRDFVIVPNITFIASCNAIRYTGADPILIDVDPNTWQMDLNLLADFLKKKTSRNAKGELTVKGTRRRIAAVMPVHVLGNMCDMDRFMAICDQYGLPVVEDSTEAQGSTWKGRSAGSFGVFGCFSFNGNKLITTGGGGVIVTSDEQQAKMAKHLTTQAKSDDFEYIHDHIGYNYRLVNLLAAVGVAQMEQLPGFILRKKAIFQRYQAGLAGVGDVRFQEIPPEVDCNCWLVTIKSERQKEILQTLLANEVLCRPFWRPMNMLTMFERDIYVSEKNHSKEVYEHCLSIPCSTNLSDPEIDKVIEVIRSVFQ